MSQTVPHTPHRHAVSPSPPRPFRSSSFTSSGIPLSPIVSPHQSPSKQATPTHARPVPHHQSSSSTSNIMDGSSPRPSTPGQHAGSQGNNNKPSTPGSGYTHPYRIQSSASGVLTRSNSAQSVNATVLSPPLATSAGSSGYGYGSWGYQSPTPGNGPTNSGNAPGTPGGGTHRSSKSLSNLRGSVSVDDLASRAMADDSRGIAFPTSETSDLPSGSPASIGNASSGQPDMVYDNGTIRQTLTSGRRYNSLSGTVVRPLVAQWTGESASGSGASCASAQMGEVRDRRLTETREGDSTIKSSPRRVEKFLWPEHGHGTENGGMGEGEGGFGDGSGGSGLGGGRKGSRGLTDGERRSIAALPPNPKAWTPSDLSTFISISLIHGISPSSPSASALANSTASANQTSGSGGQSAPIGIDSQVRALPKEVVRDIENWVLRHRLDGKSFLRGGEGSWVSSAKPPPFLPVLLSLSRHLRRASLKNAPISQAFFEASVDRGHARDDSLHSRISSVLHEDSGEDNASALTDGESEDDAVERATGWDDEDLSRFSKVKRMIGSYDARSANGSDAGDEAQEAEPAHRPEYHRARSSSISSTRSFASTISDRVEMLENAFSPRPVESETGHRSRKRPSKEAAPIGDDIPELQETSPFGTVKGPGQAHFPGLSVVGLGILRDEAGQASEQHSSHLANQHSPPPAYASPNLASPPRGQMITHPLVLPQVQVSQDLTPIPSPVRTPRKQPGSANLINAIPLESTHMSHMIEHAQHGARPYGALRRNLSSGGASASGPRLPTLKSLAAQAAADALAVPTDSADMSRESTPDDESDPRNTGRRVTLKPIPKVSDVFPAFASARSPSRTRRSSLAAPSDHEEEVHRLLDTMSQRLQAAEDRIAELEGEVELGKTSRMPLYRAPYAEKLPQGVRELPTYVAMIALGLSVVVIQTIFRRSG